MAPCPFEGRAHKEEIVLAVIHQKDQRTVGLMDKWIDGLMGLRVFTRMDWWSRGQRGLPFVCSPLRLNGADEVQEFVFDLIMQLVEIFEGCARNQVYAAQPDSAGERLGQRTFGRIAPIQIAARRRGLLD